MEAMDRKTLEGMLQQGNDNAMLRYALGSLLLKEGQAGPAVAHLQQALKLDPAHSASWKLLAKALTGDGRVSDAIAAYEQGIGVAEGRGDIQAAKEMKVFLKRLLKAS